MMFGKTILCYVYYPEFSCQKLKYLHSVRAIIPEQSIEHIVGIGDVVDFSNGLQSVVTILFPPFKKGIFQFTPARNKSMMLHNKSIHYVHTSVFRFM